jgi:hypothetical protein
MQTRKRGCTAYWKLSKKPAERAYSKELYEVAAVLRDKKLA